MIGACDCCSRQEVPLSHFNVDGEGGPEAFVCYLCQGENDPDPYGELEGSPKWAEDNGQFGVGA